MTLTTTVSISAAAKHAGQELARRERRSLSGQIEILILAEARRRGLKTSGLNPVRRRRAKTAA